MEQLTHADMLTRIVDDLRDVFEASPDGVYVWVDEVHKDCNERLATMFGRSITDWKQCPEFLDSFIAEEDRERFSWNYYHHVRGMRHPVTFRFRGLRADGSTFPAETDMIPLSMDGHPVAYHFVRELKE